MALTSSGEISLLDIFRNREDNGSATGTDIDIQTLAVQIASGSTVGDVDGNGTANQTADRNALNSAPYAFDEFYSANYPNDIFSNVIAKVGSTSVMGNGYVDGETAKIEWDIDDGTTDDYTAGLKYVSDNSVAVSATLDDDGNSKTVSVTMTVPNVDAAADKYYPFVTTGTYSNIVGANIDHFDAIGAVSIDAVSTTTVANTSTDTNITHGRSIADVSSLNDYNWSFVKTAGDGSGVSNGEGGYGTVTSTVSEPTITYRGPGTFTADLRVDGTPTQARNSTTATQVSHEIHYTKAVSIGNPSDVNSGATINTSVTHQGFSSGVDVDLIRADNNNVLLQNDHGTNSTITKVTNQNQTFTAPDQASTTLSVKVKAFDGSDTATSNAFDIFPLLTTSKNTINPASQTIFSQTDNPDTSTYPISFAFGSPGTRTDNITQGTYSEQADGSNAIALSGDLTPSSQTATQPTCTSTTTVGGATVRYTAAGNSSQSTFTDCAVTVNYATNIYQTAASIAGQATINNDITFSWSWQGVAISSERYELINQDDDAQDGNDLDVTDVTGGGAQSRNSSGSQTKTVANFGVSNGGTYKIKITLFSDSGHTNAVANALTPEFEAFSITEFTSTIKGVGLEGAFFGYVSRLLAAENNSSSNGLHNRIISQEISGGKLFALNVNAGSLVATNNDLSTAFNPLAAGVSGATFLHRDGSVLNIGSDGVIDDVTDATPATLTVGGSEVADSTSTITINITGNTLVTRTLRVSYTPSGGSESTVTVSPSSQTTSLNQNYQITSLTSGTTYAIKVRGENEAENGNYSNIVNFDTDAVVRTLATSDSATADVTMRFTGTSFISAHAARNKYSDTFVITVGNCVSNDKCVITTTASGDNLTDFSVKLAANTDNGTSPWNTSTGAEVGTDVDSSGAVTTSTARSITFSGLSAGTNTLTCRLRAEYDGSTNNEVSDQTMTATITALVQNSAGSTVLASATMHTVNVEHLPGA